ncbi:SgcJ/EcaC family oxidoreductase [Arthrobacter sp. ISL-30]|uniref:SgcJ/EcaC family oxidoreductase n=1 Tax=Arthrobacter sp. ISL-30 TaxID=2819109 RepID=UPI001BE55CD4|nr:SgcJ/EcaC family oxidoreductase [Arthrobacter sp. ISL-30]MBT2512991.1 SgcJ/EcaC family oxidoreductase [Arthrobacter sp. ISL-30]
MHTRTKTALIVVSASLMTMTGCAAGSAEAKEVTNGPSPVPANTIPEQQVEALFDEWNASLATGDPAKVDAMYAADAVLLPTVAPGVHDTSAERVGYFTAFLQNDPTGTVDEGVVRPLGPNAVSHSGLYSFTMGTTGEVVKARFTFVYERINGEWKIVEHHSSKEPAAK